MFVESKKYKYILNFVKILSVCTCYRGPGTWYIVKLFHLNISVLKLCTMVNSIKNAVYFCAYERMLL